MDKYEFNTKIDKIKKHYLKQNYAAAVKIADEIDFKGLKEWKTIALLINLYETVGRPRDVRYFCILAYNRNLGGRKLLYKLTKVCIALDELDEAEDLYEEFSRSPGNDSKKLELKFEIRNAQSAGVDELIEILEELNKIDFDDKYGYILAYLYSKTKQYEKCVELCNLVIDNFVDGEYVDKAKDLKSFYIGANGVQEPERVENPAQMAATKVFRSKTRLESLERDVSGRERAASLVRGDRKSASETSKGAEGAAGSPVSENKDENGAGKTNEAIESARRSVQEVVENAHRSVESTYEEVKKEAEMDAIRVKVPDNSKFDTKSLQDTIAKGVSDCIDDVQAEDIFKVNISDEATVSEDVYEDYEYDEEVQEGIQEESSGKAVDETEVYVEEVEAEKEEPVIELRPEKSEDAEVKEALYMVAAALAEEVEEQSVIDKNAKPSVDDMATNKITISPRTHVKSEDQETAEDYDMPIAARRYFTKYNNISGLVAQIADFLKSTEGEESEQKMGTSCVGNLIISGNRSSDKKQLAINIVKALNEMDNDRVRKIATTSGDSINQRGIAKSIGKIAGAALIIEEAGILERRRVEELVRVMESDTDEMLVILEDSESEIKLLLKNNPELTKLFNHRIVYKQYNVNELVEMCKRYADKNNFIIDDKAMFLLYSHINEIHAHGEGVNLEEVRAVVDKAIDKAEKRAGRLLFGGIKKKKIDDKEYYILVESDFKE